MGYLSAVVLLMVLPFEARAEGPLVCMTGSPRCGICAGVMDECLNMEGVCNADDPMEAFDAGSIDACRAYVSAATGMPSGVTESDLTDERLGLPRLGYAITRSVFSAGLQSVRNSSASNGCDASMLQNGITGQDLQDCINGFIVSEGEQVLEKAACEYVTAGVGTAFCDSMVFKGAIAVINAVANHFIEAPIVHAMDNFEDACVDAAKSVANAVRDFFNWQEMKEPGSGDTHLFTNLTVSRRGDLNQIVV